MSKHTQRSPAIYDVVELPESEKGAQCPRWTGDPPRRCTNSSEYVFVYEANLNPDDNKRRNCLCCSGCKPRSVDTGTKQESDRA